MRATVQVIPPTGNGQHVTLEMLEKALADKKIVHGIDREALQRIVDTHAYVKAITVANGDAPENGTDAQIVYHYAKLVTRQDAALDNLAAHVDYREVGKVISADPDVLLLEKIPPTEGKPGKTIVGKPIRQVKGKDLRIRAGKGVSVDPDGLRWRSEIAGQVIFRNDQISVENMLELENVDAESGNVHFKGTVIVKGIVEDGFVVESAADIRVMGSVGAAKLTAKGVVVIVGGVFGKGQAEIESTEASVYVRFAQDAKLRAADSIHVEEYARNSAMRAGRAIHVVNENHSRGRILGGSASAMEEIHCNNIGGEMEIPTRIMVGVSKEDLDRIAALEANAERRRQNLESLRKSLFLAQRQKLRGGGRPDERRDELYRRVLQMMARLRVQARQEGAELANLYRSSYVQKRGYVHVVNQVFSNVEINIQLATLTVRKTQMFVSFTNQEGEVVILPFVEHAHGSGEADKGRSPAGS
jgi:uncharacterized protein (DUF342 family)